MLQNKVPNNSWLVKDNNKKIREKSIDVKLPLSKEDELVMKRLIDFVKFSQDSDKNKNELVRPAVGLAAPQIGHNIKMFYINIRKDNYSKKNVEHALINPEIIGTSVKKAALEYGEGCLSVDKNHEGYVERSYKIILTGYDYLQQKNVKITVKNYEAIVVQHEQGHLNGKLYYDIININNPWKQNKDVNYI